MAFTVKDKLLVLYELPCMRQSIDSRRLGVSQKAIYFHRVSDSCLDLPPIDHPDFQRAQPAGLLLSTRGIGHNKPNLPPYPVVKTCQDYESTCTFVMPLTPGKWANCRGETPFARCTIQPDGEPVKKIAACVAFVFLALALVPTAAHARTTTEHAKSKSSQAQKDAQKQWKKQSKQQAKAQKKQMKKQKKEGKKNAKELNKKNKTTVSVT
jgi:hypothetical protein